MAQTPKTAAQNGVLPAWNAPIVLTWLRIAFIPLFVAVFFLRYDWAYPVCALIFALGSVTDWLDGFLARRWRQESAFGAFLDPVADKLMVVSAIVMLVERDGELALVVPSIIIIGREIAVSALREWMASIGRREVVAVANIGKFKTFVQMVAIVVLLYKQPLFGISLQGLGLVLFQIAAVLTLWSLAIYVRAVARMNSLH